MAVVAEAWVETSVVMTVAGSMATKAAIEVAVLRVAEVTEVVPLAVAATE